MQILSFSLIHFLEAGHQVLGFSETGPSFISRAEEVGVEGVKGPPTPSA